MGDEDLKKKKKIRGHKGYVTRMTEKIPSLLDHFEPDVVNQLKTYRTALEEKLKILGGLHNETLGLLKEDQIEEKIEETGNFRESIHEMIVKIDYGQGQIHWDSTAFYLSTHVLLHILGFFAAPSPPFNVAWGK